MPDQLLAAFDPPAFLDDLNDTLRAAWSGRISEWEDAEVRPSQGVRFYNPTRTPTADDQQTLDILWTGFPRLVQISSPTNRIRWSRADAARTVQDEYCEWSVRRDPVSRKITRVQFTCEGPEYWRFLANNDPDKALALYQSHISPNVQRADLFGVDGFYIPTNRWNSTTSEGAMHLVHRNNTLTAEINIAARSTIVRFVNGRLLTGERELIDCGRYGSPERFSDPHIGGEVNKLARLDSDITIDNPVAIYIDSLSTAGWMTPDDSDPNDYWTITRGTDAHAVGGVYEVPEGKDFVVGDIRINGEAIEFGAQIADFISMRVRGLACRFGQSQVPRITACEGFPFAAANAANISSPEFDPAFSGQRN